MFFIPCRDITLHTSNGTIPSTDLFVSYETKNVDDYDKTPLYRLSGNEWDIQM
jgi:hypothetical protein